MHGIITYWTRPDVCDKAAIKAALKPFGYDRFIHRSSPLTGHRLHTRTLIPILKQLHALPLSYGLYWLCGSAADEWMRLADALPVSITVVPVDLETTKGINVIQCLEKEVKAELHRLRGELAQGKKRPQFRARVARTLDHIGLKIHAYEAAFGISLESLAMDWQATRSLAR